MYRVDSKIRKNRENSKLFEHILTTRI